MLCFCRTTNPLLLPAKPSSKLSAFMPTSKERCLLSSLKQRDSECMSMVDPLPSNQTTTPWNPSPRRTWQTCQPGCSACYCTSRAMITSSITTPVWKWPAWHPLLLQSTSWPWHPTGHCHSPCLPVPRVEGSLSTSLHEWSWDACSCRHHHHWLARWHKGSPSPITPLLATPWDPHHWRWPCPPWRSPHCSSFRKGESTTITPPVPSRNHQSPVAHMQIHLLAWHKQSHWRSCSSVWDLHPVPSLECCSTPHAYTNSIPPMADVDHRLLYLGRSWLPHMWWLLLKDDPCPMSPSSQSNTAKVVLLLKEMFSEHRIPEALCSENGPQYASAQFTDFFTSWGITHETLSPHYQQSNGFAEACVKSVKHALQCAKCNGANLQLTLLELRATPINANLLSPAELLYQWQLRTTIPAKIQNTDPAALQVHEQIATCSNAFKSQADKWCKSLAPLYAGQPIAMYDTLHKIWIPTTVVCILPSTATKYTPAMVWSTATWDDTFVNTVSSQLKLFQTPQQPHCRLLPDLTSLHHSLHNWHNLCQLHPQHLWLWSHRPQLSPPCQLSQRLPLHPCLWHPMQPPV